MKGTAGSSGVTNNISAYSIILERRVSDRFSYGFGFTHEDIDQVQDIVPTGFSQSGRLGQKSYEVSVFGRFTKGIFAIEPHLRIGFDDYNLERPDTLTNKGLVGRAETRGYHAGFFIEATATVPFNDHVFLRPVLNFDYEYTTADPFTETGVSIGPNNFNLSYNRVSDRRAIGEAGLGVAAIHPLRQSGTLTVFAVGKYRRNFITGPITAQASNSLMQLGTVTLSNGQERDGFLFDTGFFVAGRNNMEIWATYRGQFFQNSSRHGLSGQIKIRF